MEVKKVVIAMTIMFAALPIAHAQHVGVKTNILYDALLSPTVGIEVGLAPKWSLDVSGTANFWTVNDRRWRQWMVQPEARYWFCQRSAGHFLGFHAIGGQYNFGNLNLGIDNFLGTDLRQLRDHRLQGWMVGAGVAYGYSWVLNASWNLEAEIGAGWIYTQYDRFMCEGCGAKDQSRQVHNYVGPTKAAINLIYNF